MLLGMQLPSWKQILGLSKKENKGFYEEPDYFFLSESCMSINIIMNAIRAIKRKERISVWVPDYFCNQTVYSFFEQWMDIEYYKINTHFEPVWDGIRSDLLNKHIDAFIFTHYFGEYHSSISVAREICDLHNAILVEDCAHVLYPNGKIGCLGDCAIYSPHKQIPIIDGAVLKINNLERNLALYNEVKRIESSLPQKTIDYKWIIKRCVQKIIPMHKALTYYSGIHVGEHIVDRHLPKKISAKGYKMLCGYTYEDLKKIAYIRRDNLVTMNYIIKKINPDITPIMDSQMVHVPYFAVYSLEKCKDKKSAVEELLKRDFTVLYWPDLPYELIGSGEHENAFELSENIIVIPIHQGLSPQLLIKKFVKSKKIDRSDVLGISVVDVNGDDTRWDNLFGAVNLSNIPQERLYGTAKTDTEGWYARRFFVQRNGKDIGVLQILEKKIFDLTVAVRINRGPIFTTNEDGAETHFLAIECLRKRYLFSVPFVYAPFLEATPYNLCVASKYGWKCFNHFGFPSSVIDLSQSEESLYRNLKSNWRKNLKKAQKEVLVRINQYNATEIINLYGDFLKRKNIPGIPEHILRHLFFSKNCPLEVLTAHNSDGEMIAYKVLYKHGKTATSFIAWNTDEGLEKNARTLLIYESMLLLKRNDFCFYDLGGVDDINTEAVARYKRGMGGTDYRLLGEFVKVLG